MMSSYFKRIPWLILGGLLTASAKPNIIFILADAAAYGDGKTIPIPENQGVDGGDSMKTSNFLKLRPDTYRADGLYVDLNGKTGAELVFSEDYYRKTAREFIQTTRIK
jgi:hypothetical protein